MIKATMADGVVTITFPVDNLDAVKDTPKADPPDGINTVRDAELYVINKQLAFYHGNRKNAAHALGISERTLYRKIIDYDIK